MYVNDCEDIFLFDIVIWFLVFEKCSVVLERIVQDYIVNNYGYKLIEFCKNNDMYIVNGCMYNDKNIGRLICKNSSIVDYVLVSIYIFEFI